MVAQHRREMRLRQALLFFRTRVHQRIYDRLNDPSKWLGNSPRLPLSPGGTARLDEVIAVFRVFVARPFPGLRSGFPVEVDPVGLKEAGQSLTSPAQLPPATSEDVSLHEQLRRILEPMNLTYEIKDGTVLITSRQAVQRSHEGIRKLLDHSIVLTWPLGASLEDVIEQVRLNTRGPELPLGLPIYVDPASSGDLDLPHATVSRSPTEALPIRVHLDRVLAPLQLRYELRNGSLMILAQHKAGEAGKQQGSPLK
jgi:hypothetical protein